MFDGIRGTMAGTDIGGRTCRCTMAIVNGLIEKGFTMKLPQTVEILKECYFLLFFKAIKPSAGAIQLGSASVQAQSIITDWLIEMIAELDPDADVGDVIEAEQSSLDVEFTLWADQLREEHPELVDQPKNEWTPMAVELTLQNIGEILGLDKSTDALAFDTIREALDRHLQL